MSPAVHPPVDLYNRALDPEDTSAILIRPVEKLRVVTGPIDVFLRLEARSRLWIAVHPMSLTCLQGSQLSLHGIGLGASSADVRRLVGTPAVEIDDSTDAGGVHHRAHLWYSNFLVDVDLDENHVTLLETTSPYVALPFDISVWATLQDVGRRLRLSDPAQYLRGDTLPLTSCGRSLDDRGMSGLDLIFEPVPRDSTRRLRKIRVFERSG